MEAQETVSHIMTTSVQTVEISAPLRDVVEIIKQKRIRHIPVVEGDKIVGIISSTDINRLTFGNLFENQDTADEAVLEMLQIEQVMTNKPQIVNSHTTIKEVAITFVSSKFHALPVVDDGKLVGIVTTTDVIKYLLSLY